VKEGKVRSGRRVCKEYEKNTGRGKDSTRESPGRNEKIHRQEEEQGGRISSGRLSNVKHKRSEVADEEEKIREVNRAFYRLLQNKGHYIN